MYRRCFRALYMPIKAHIKERNVVQHQLGSDGFACRFGNSAPISVYLVVLICRIRMSGFAGILKPYSSKERAKCALSALRVQRL